MDINSLPRNLSNEPFIRALWIAAPTMLQIWFDRNAIDLTPSDVTNLHQQLGWITNGRVIIRDDEIFDGLFELLFPPGCIEESPATLQQVLDYITQQLRAAAPGCADYRLDHDQVEPQLLPDGSADDIA